MLNEGAKGLRSKESLGRGLGLVALDPYPVFSLARLGQVVRGLPAQPEIRVGPPCLLKPNGHIGRDRRVAVQNSRKSVAGNAENPRRLRDAQAKGLQAVLPDAAAGVRRILPLPAPCPNSFRVL